MDKNFIMSLNAMQTAQTVLRVGKSNTEVFLTHNRHIPLLMNTIKDVLTYSNKTGMSVPLSCESNFTLNFLLHHGSIFICWTSAAALLGAIKAVFPGVKRQVRRHKRVFDVTVKKQVQHGYMLQAQQYHDYQEVEITGTFCQIMWYTLLAARLMYPVKRNICFVEV